MNKNNFPKFITEIFLRTHPECIFVFGDNLKRKGYGGAAVVRDLKNTYGFITKKYPTNDLKSFYTQEEYVNIFFEEVGKFLRYVNANRDKTFLVSKLGAGLANKHKIFEKIINPYFKRLELTDQFPNIVLVGWDD